MAKKRETWAQEHDRRAVEMHEALGAMVTALRSDGYDEEQMVALVRAQGGKERDVNALRAYLAMEL